jgi:hypothetical protein
MRAAATFHTPQQTTKNKKATEIVRGLLEKLLKLKSINADSPGHGTKSGTPYAGGRLDGLGLG